jgi:hypothetical protein
MNRRDAAMIAHLDAIEARLTSHLTLILKRLDDIADDIAGMKVEHAIHRHDDEG